MNILIVDSNQDDLEQTVKCLQSVYPDAQLIPFDDAMDAVRYGYNHPVDAVYTEISMRHITGFDVARLLRKVHPEMTVCFLSDTEKHLRLSIQNGGDGYYLKPIDAEILLYGNRIADPARQNLSQF